MLPMSCYLVLGALIFGVGVLGVLIRRNVLVIFMSIELMLSAVNLTFVTLSRYLETLHGQVCVFFVMTVSAAEVAVGLAIIMMLFRNLGTTNIDEVRLMKE
ncbi:NADH dehydrogenase subunit K [Syntrophus gentianae]|uniref:NADH-quinone oxidoreductase subunit K n=1 Tax=Syntrophus gentianae TaxID=43775 RepID=A0A1H7ZLM3_9BACT|nr:NADH-quinone oxidoreductase subunit NuoK [Syntrophus gentianae]SEM58389.1 NADH dehydrogenase subunit K [Syntrophus gentianae]